MCQKRQFQFGSHKSLIFKKCFNTEVFSIHFLYNFISKKQNDYLKRTRLTKQTGTRNTDTQRRMERKNNIIFGDGKKWPVRLMAININT